MKNHLLPIGLTLEQIKYKHGKYDPNYIYKYINFKDPARDREIEVLMSSGIQPAELIELNISVVNFDDENIKKSEGGK